MIAETPEEEHMQPIIEIKQFKFNSHEIKRSDIINFEGNEETEASSLRNGEMAPSQHIRNLREHFYLSLSDESERYLEIDSDEDTDETTTTNKEPMEP